jgi:hypothetical protein
MRFYSTALVIMAMATNAASSDASNHNFRTLGGGGGSTSKPQQTTAARGRFGYERHRPAIAYSRVGTGQTPSAVLSSSNFPASVLGSELGLIAQSCRAFFHLRHGGRELPRDPQ